MKSILLHVHEDVGEEARIKAALDIVRATSGHLTCIQATPMAAYVAFDPFGGAYPLAGIYDCIEKENAKVRSRVEARLASENASWEWKVYDGAIEQTIIRCSQLADLIVLGQKAPGQPEGRQPVVLATDVAIHARSPVLMMPATATGFDPKGVALVAWNGSPEASNALRMALPLLQLASAVHVATVDNESEDFSSVDAQRYLFRHGISSETQDIARRDRSVAYALIDASTSIGAAYIVMGAFGHSRFREAVLGGVTREITARSPVPLLLAH